MEATNIQPFIHIFHVCGKNYLYDANRNVILKIGSELYNDIRSTLHDGDSFSLTPEMAGLLHEGYMQPSAIEKIEHPMTSKIEKLLDNSLHMLTLQVTQNCNLRCRYCVYSGSYINRHHSNKHMTFDIAKMAIDYYLAHSSQTTKLRFGFYGGEPLLEKTLIKECVNYIERNTLGKSVEFNITTNATLINEEFMNFIVEHSFFLTISFDGAKEIQDKNRIYASSGKGTFDKVMETVIWIRKKYPEFMSRVRFNMVIDPADGYKLSNDFFMSDERVKDIFVTAGEKNDNNLTEEIYVHPDYNRNKSYEEFKAIASYFRGNADRVSPLAAVYLKS